MYSAAWSLCRSRAAAPRRRGRRSFRSAGESATPTVEYRAWRARCAGRFVTPATLVPPNSVGPAALAAPGRRGLRGTRGPGLARRDELPVHPRAAARTGSGRDIPKLPGYPAVHVVRGDIPGHRRDGRPASALRQGQRMLDAQRQAFGVEGVARYGLAELGAGAGELAEDHRTAAMPRVLDRDVLLGDQVHAVDERRDEHHVGDGIVRRELLGGQRSMQVMDGDVRARLGELAVDPADMPFH